MKAAYGIAFYRGANALLDIEPNKERLYVLPRIVEYDVRFDDGTLHVRTERGFKFDGRSGPSIIDCYVPNLGSLEERVAWHMHDCLGYAQSLDFKDTNLALKLVLRDLAGYGRFKAELIRTAVSISKSWYGEPKPDDPWYCNIGKVRTAWR